MTPSTGRFEPRMRGTCGDRLITPDSIQKAAFVHWLGAPDLQQETGGFGRVFVLVCAATERAAMSETRKIAAILVADVVGFGRLAGADEDRTLARLRALRSDLIDPTIAGASSS